MPLPSGPRVGIALYLVALVLFTWQDTATKLALDELPVLQVLWARFVFHLITVSIVLGATGTRLPPVSRAPRLQAFRSLLLVAGNLCFIVALWLLPLAETTVIGFLSPVLTVVAAAIWLGERVTKRRLVALVLGFVGVLIVVRPGGAMFQPAALLPLGTAVVFAGYQILTRVLAPIDDARTTIFHTGLAGTAVTTLLLPFGWEWPSAHAWMLLIMVGSVGAASHTLLILAYARAPAGVVAPFAYAQIATASAAGWLFFAEVPDAGTIAGAAVIAGAGLLALPRRSDDEAMPERPRSLP